MSKPFDATTKRLLELDPAGWLTCVGLPVTGPVRAVDSDLSTVTAEADTILQVGEPPTTWPTSNSNRPRPDPPSPALAL